MKLKIGICQVDPSRRSPEENVGRAAEQCEKAARKGALLVLLPELFPFGPLPDMERACKAAGLTPVFLSRLEDAARKNNITICAGLPWKEEDNGILNSQFVIAPSGEPFRYDKLHLFPPFKETSVFKAGKSPRPLWLDNHGAELGLGPMICFDIRFPELARYYSVSGCHLLIVSALWPLSRKDNLVALLKARAMENQCFIAGANACGRCQDTEFAGSSLVSGPDGKLSAQAGREEALIVSEIETGTVSSTRAVFNSAWPRGEWNFPTGQKVCNVEAMRKTVKRRQAIGQKMVFTNGCFDILHAGHVSYLKKARLLGDFLVLGLNSDSSITRIKGRGRPLNPQEQRAMVLSALSFVDYVVIFDEDTPEKLIRELVPDVLVKGADWKEDEIVGADVVKSRGGRVERIKFEVDTSTTKIIHKIRKHSRDSQS